MSGLLPITDKYLLFVTSLSHAGKSFFYDNFRHSIFIFGNENEPWPKCKSGQSQGYMLGSRFTRTFYYDLTTFKYHNYLTDGFAGNRTNGVDILKVHPSVLQLSRLKYINFVRDPRIVWMLENHYGYEKTGTPDKLNKDELLRFINIEVKTWWDHYIMTSNALKQNALTIRFEDYISNFDNINLQLIKFMAPSNSVDFMNFITHLEYIRTTKRLNDYFSMIDLENPCFYTNQSQEFLDIISDKCSYLIEYFNYPKRLILSDIFKNL